MRLRAIVVGLILLLAFWGVGATASAMSASHVTASQQHAAHHPMDDDGAGSHHEGHLKHCKWGHAVGCGFAGSALMPEERGVAASTSTASTLSSHQDARKPAWAMPPERPPKGA